MVRLYKPFKSTPPPRETIKKMREANKRLVDVFFSSDNGENLDIDWDIYPNFQNQWTIYHGKKQQIPYALYSHIKSLYTKELDCRIDKKTGEKLEDEAGKKKPVYQIELV